ncbi:unnamed protein product [Paramecium sonneborni]|uniref:Uncharacterized protein n=1 Tax=Paramecium sonneborni TaxID=65129 RepID=A0A8S1MN53_9CILI|nr:unnamed protein product [Paramecium sonneborni]
MQFNYFETKSFLSKYQTELNIEFQTISIMEKEYIHYSLNQLQYNFIQIKIFIKFIMIFSYINNEISFEKIKKIYQEFPLNYSSNLKRFWELKQRIITKTLDKQQIIQQSKLMKIRLIISQILNYCNLQLNISMNILNLKVVEQLVKVETTDIKALQIIINIAIINFEEVKYNLDLCNKGIKLFKRYLVYPKRVVREAVQEEINKLCIVFCQGL